MQRMKRLMPLALAVVAFGQAQQPAAPVPNQNASESPEHKYAQRKFGEATGQCAELQTQYEALESKVKGIMQPKHLTPDDLAILRAAGQLSADGTLKPDVMPVVTTCTALRERSASVVNDAKQMNDIIDQGHQLYIRRAKEAIAFGRDPSPEEAIGEHIPLTLLRQVNDVTVAHDEIVKEIPVLESRSLHADDCVAVYQKTIDKKASDLTVRESEQVKACQSEDLYPPDK